MTFNKILQAVKETASEITDKVKDLNLDQKLNDVLKNTSNTVNNIYSKCSSSPSNELKYRTGEPLILGDVVYNAYNKTFVIYTKENHKELSIYQNYWLVCANDISKDTINKYYSMN